jgi:hypothetical protein
MTKFEMVKKLEYLIALQADFLQQDDWEDFDHVENSIKELETSILKLISK